MQTLLRFLGGEGLLTSDEWEPHAATAQPGLVFASRFAAAAGRRRMAGGGQGRAAGLVDDVIAQKDSQPQAPTQPQPQARTQPGAASTATVAAEPWTAPLQGGCAVQTAWTLVERAGKDWPASTPMLEVDDTSFSGCTFYDLYHGTTLQPTPVPGAGKLTLAFALEAHGVGGVLATGSSALSTLAPMLSRMANMTAAPLSSFDAVWRAAHQVRVPSTEPDPITHNAAPAGAVAVPASLGFDFKCAGSVIEPFDEPSRASLGIDVRFEWEDLARNEHERASMPIRAFYLDRAPVSMERYARYLRNTGYAPADASNFLREWPDWRKQVFPAGNASVPVTGVSLAEARAFCRWADGRLPTSVEWQYAAQAGNAANVYPWGASDDLSKRPVPVHTGQTPAPVDSTTLEDGANPLGIVDLIGNVWQYTDSEYADAHTRFVLLRGGSLYQPLAASDFQNWYFGSSTDSDPRYTFSPQKRPGGAVRLDRHAKYFLMGASYERGALSLTQPHSTCISPLAISCHPVA